MIWTEKDGDKYRAEKARHCRDANNFVDQVEADAKQDDVDGARYYADSQSAKPRPPAQERSVSE